MDLPLYISIQSSNHWENQVLNIQYAGKNRREGRNKCITLTDITPHELNSL